MRRTIMTKEHGIFRRSFDQFVDREVVPRLSEFEQVGIVDRSVWKAAGDAGFLAPEIPAEYGGVGVSDFRFYAVIGEQINARRLRGLASRSTTTSSRLISCVLAPKPKSAAGCRAW